MNESRDVLVIEDEAVVQEAAGRILGLQGLEVDAALDANAAGVMLRDRRYKVVLTDLMLPRSSGFDLLELARDLDRDVQVIVITGYATLAHAVRSFKLGAFDFLPKPFDVGELLGAVSRALGYREACRGARGEKPPHSSASGKRYFLGGHAWAALESEGSAILGLGETFPGLMGSVQRISLPVSGGHTNQGYCFFQIYADEGNYRVWAPLSGKILALNNQLEANPELIDTDPYGAGWIVRIVPTNLDEELQHLSKR